MRRPHRPVPWKTTEIAALRAAYLTGGTKGAMKALPRRSQYSIEYMASHLGLCRAPFCVSGSIADRAVHLAAAGPIMARDLADHVGIQPKTCAAILGQMVRRGLMEKTFISKRLALYSLAKAS